MGGIGDLVPLIVIGGIAYYVLVLNPGFIQSLIPSGAAPAAGGSTTPTGTTACQGKDPSGAACDCPATGAAAFAYPGMYYAYKGKKKSKGKSKGSKSSSSSSSGGSSGSSSTSTGSSTSKSTACDCSACTGAKTPTTPSGNSIWCKCVAGKWAQDPTFKGASVKCALIGQTCTATAGLAETDLNSFTGAQIANEGWGFQSLQAYTRRNW